MVYCRRDGGGNGEEELLFGPPAAPILVHILRERLAAELYLPNFRRAVTMAECTQFKSGIVHRRFHLKPRTGIESGASREQIIPSWIPDSEK